MSSSALAYFNNVEPRPGGQLTYYLAPDAAWPLINLYQGRQLSQGLQTYHNNLNQNNPGVLSVFNQLKARIPNHSNDPYLLVVDPGPNNSIPANQRFGHALVPYRVDEQAGSWGKVYVYDPNWYGDSNRYFYFDLQASPPTFDYDIGAPNHSVGNYHINSSLGWTIELIPLSQFATGDAKVLHDGIIGVLIGSGDVVHTNGSGGTIGYEQGVFTSTIPGAGPIYPWMTEPFDGGGFGVSLPQGTYQVAINNPGSYEYTAASLTNTVDISVQVGAVTSAPVVVGAADYLQIGAAGSTMFTSTAALNRSLSLQVSNNDSANERLYGIRNTNMTGAIALGAQTTSNGLVLNTSGITSTFDLDIQGLDGNAGGWFVHHGITITTGAILTVEAPYIGPASVVTVTESTGAANPSVWIFGNQVNRIFLPLVTK